MNLKRKSGFGYMTANTLPGGRLVTVSATPPLTVRHAKAQPPESITIYGNTVDGMGVGDKTVNLFDKNNYKSLNAFIDNSYPIIHSNYYSRLIYIPCMPNTEYTISKMAGSRFAVGSTAIEPQTGDSFTLLGKNWTANVISVMTPADAAYLLVWPYYADQDTGISLRTMLYSVQICEGNEALEYEPYGYKIPIVISNISGIYTTNIYTDKQLMSGSDITIDDNLPSFASGENSINVSTETPPKYLTISYYRR